MKNAAKYLLSGAMLIASAAAPAMAADVYDPPAYDVPAYDVPEYVPEAVSGWYLRGDVGYSWNKYQGADYATSTGFDGYLGGDLKKSYAVGVGGGYKFNHYLRADLTLDYDFNTDFGGSSSGVGCFTVGVPCVSTDVAKWSALTLMANAYVDLGTYGRITPYVGGGFGGSHVKWGRLANTSCDVSDCETFYHRGYGKWRFAYALMAGASIDINCKLAADIGYRYRKIQGGHMFAYDATASNGPGFDRGIASHQGRVGLRYKFGACAQPTQVVYQPEPLPPVYK